MSNKRRLFIVIVIPAALLGLFGWTPPAYVWLPPIEGNEKNILAAVALLTMMAFLLRQHTATWSR